MQVLPLRAYHMIPPAFQDRSFGLDHLQRCRLTSPHAVLHGEGAQVELFSIIVPCLKSNIKRILEIEVLCPPITKAILPLQYQCGSTEHESCPTTLDGKYSSNIESGNSRYCPTK